jgi:elongation factor Ts
MEITAKMVAELRERTGSGMMECKKALVAAKGDIELAIEEMRKAGAAKADKKANRVAAEGVIVIKQAGNQAAMVEINSETDFVARQEDFCQFASKVAEHIAKQAAQQSAEVDLAQHQNFIDADRKPLIVKIGENINVRRAYVAKAPVIGTYLHGTRIGVLVEMEGGSVDLAKDLAMHIAASSPIVVSPDQVPADLVTKEKDIFIAQAKDSGKPMEIIEKMVQGRINKFLDEQSLTGQPFVKDPNQKVGALLKANNAKVLSFKRFMVGEGIEKEKVDFATEVMQQARGG